MRHNSCFDKVCFFISVQTRDGWCIGNIAELFCGYDIYDMIN